MALNQISICEIFSAGAFPAGVRHAMQLLPAVLTACGWALNGEGDVDTHPESSQANLLSPVRFGIDIL